MKTLSAIFVTFIIVLFSGINAPAFSQEPALEGNVDAEIKVLGLCGMCKDRIEKAAYSVRGVRSASWDQQKNVLSVNYRANRTNQQEIERTIAKAGHDTENFITDEETYKNLHHCCKYPRDPEMLKNNNLHNQE
jgi:periplasmic mercuric ion binding protein